MTRKKRLIKRQHISKGKFKSILDLFCQDLTAIDTAKIVKVNRKTVNRYFNYFRTLILKNQLKEDKNKFDGEVEIDESYFGAKRIRGKRGRGAKGKIPVIGILKRNGTVHTKIVKNCTREELLPIIRGKILEDTQIYTDGWRSYDALIVSGYRHYRIYHSKNEFARGKNHINGIESFWSFVKRRLNKFNGVPRNKFLIYLKESEWRFNNRKCNLKQKLKNLIKEDIN
jgi:transposase